MPSTPATSPVTLRAEFTFNGIRNGKAQCHIFFPDYDEDDNVELTLEHARQNIAEFGAQQSLLDARAALEKLTAP